MEDNQKHLKIRIPEQLHEELSSIAREDRRSLTQTVIIALQEWCKKRAEGGDK